MKHITQQNFSQEVEQAQGVVVVDFYADWCGPCKMLAPELEEVEKELNGKVKIVKINVDEEEALAYKFRIMSIPTLLFYKDGVLMHKQMGYITKNQLIRLIEEM